MFSKEGKGIGQIMSKRPGDLPTGKAAQKHSRWDDANPKATKMCKPASKSKASKTQSKEVRPTVPRTTGKAKRTAQRAASISDETGTTTTGATVIISARSSNPEDLSLNSLSVPDSESKNSLST